jgi:hypothetical protein
MFPRSVLQLIVDASVVPSWLIAPALKIEATRSSETALLTRATLRHIPKEDILPNRRHENLKSYAGSGKF